MLPRKQNLLLWISRTFAQFARDCLFCLGHRCPSRRLITSTPVLRFLTRLYLDNDCGNWEKNGAAVKTLLFSYLSGAQVTQNTDLAMRRKSKSLMEMKTVALALALFGATIGVPQKAAAKSGEFRQSHRDYDRNYHRDYHGDYRQEYDQNYDWDHPYWRSHRYGFWHHHRGYWDYRDHRHIFIDVD